MDLPPQVFPVTEHHRGQRLDRFLQAMIPRMSRAAVQEALASRVALASGLPPKASRRLVPGDAVTILPRPRRGAAPEAPAVLHAGAGFTIIDKPAGMPSVPSARHAGNDAASVTGLAPAHRLDRFTSGCLLLTATSGAARHFAGVFAAGLARKEYAAVVVGHPGLDRWIAEAPLGPDAASRVPGRVAAAPEGSAGRAARTCFRVVGRFSGQAGPLSLVEAIPETGRRHQIRVHLALAGHPVVGDLLYGGDERRFVRFQLGQAVAVPEGLAPGRHLLHARALTLPAPGGAELRVEAPWPKDFRAACPEWAESLPEAAVPERMEGPQAEP